MSPWRRPVPPSRVDSQDLAHVAAGLLLAGLALLAALVMAGCAPQVRPECPLGSLPRRVDTDTATSGAVSGSAGVLTQTGAVKGQMKSATSVDFDCGHLCRDRQLLRASRTVKGSEVTETVECLAASPAPAVGTSKLPPQGP